jgi:regulator of protease activity HflC (stomatin/prohibitin superfamily)
VNPFTVRIVVSTRIRNQESSQLKVNDADGNPIEIAAVVVWQVRDTASAMYAVDQVTKFVTIQMETAVRHIASRYPLRQPRQRRAVAARRAGHPAGREHRVAVPVTVRTGYP